MDQQDKRFTQRPAAAEAKVNSGFSKTFWCLPRLDKGRCDDNSEEGGQARGGTGLWPGKHQQ
jgi:hypothetical protein